jgi:hypothetical protein
MKDGGGGTLEFDDAVAGTQRRRVANGNRCGRVWRCRAFVLYCWRGGGREKWWWLTSMGIYFDHFIGFGERRQSDINLRRQKRKGIGQLIFTAQESSRWRGLAQDGSDSDC